MTAVNEPPPRLWLAVVKRYVLALAGGNLVWEFLHMPLYTLWYEASPRRIVLYGLHCVGGDVLIALSALMTALFLLGSARWPNERFVQVATTATIVGVSYTVFSEWRNVHVEANWAYAPAMPEVLGIGLSPVAQWLILPAMAFWWAGKQAKSQ